MIRALGVSISGVCCFPKARRRLKGVRESFRTNSIKRVDKGGPGTWLK